MSGSDLALSPKQPSYADGGPPSKRARLEDSPAVSDSKERSHAPSSKLDGNTPSVPGSDVEDDDPYSLDATASAYEHKASDLYLDTVRHHAPQLLILPHIPLRLTGPCLTLILRKCAQSRLLILIHTAALSAESISKVVAAAHMPMLTPYTMTIMCSSIWRQQRSITPSARVAATHPVDYQVYVLPDGYLVSDPSLEDIAFVLNPKFTKASLANLSSTFLLSKPSYDLSHKPYLQGYVGLNDIKHNDHMNVIIHSLLHVPPLRDYLLLSDFKGKETELVKRFAALAKKIWNPRLFKSQVSPHEFLQEVNRASSGKFSLEKQGDPVEFLGWLLNRLHIDLGGTKKKNSSESWSCLQSVCNNSHRYNLLHFPGGASRRDTAGHRTP